MNQKNIAQFNQFTNNSQKIGVIVKQAITTHGKLIETFNSNNLRIKECTQKPIYAVGENNKDINHSQTNVHIDGENQIFELNFKACC